MTVTSDNGYNPNGGLRGGLLDGLRGGRGYKHVIFDADDTLLRYRDDERGAFSRLFLRHGITADDGTSELFKRGFGRSVDGDGLVRRSLPRHSRRYHELYRAHVEHVFEKILAFLSGRGVDIADGKKAVLSGTGTAVSAASLRDEFLKELETGGNLVDGAAETLSALKARGILYFDCHQRADGNSDRADKAA